MTIRGCNASDRARTEFLAGGSVGMVHDPSTFGGWVALLIGRSFFGMPVLLAAAAVLTLAGFEIRLPGESRVTPSLGPVCATGAPEGIWLGSPASGACARALRL